MYTFLSKRGQSLGFGLGLILTIIFIALIFSGFSDFDALAEDEKATTTIFNFGLIASIGLIILAFLAALVAGAIQMFIDFRSSIKFLIGLAVVVVVFGIMYSMSEVASTSEIGRLLDENDITDTVSRLISAGLWTVIVLGALSALAIIVSEVRNLIIN